MALAADGVHRYRTDGTHTHRRRACMAKMDEADENMVLWRGFLAALFIGMLGIDKGRADTIGEKRLLGRKITTLLVSLKLLPNLSTFFRPFVLHCHVRRMEMACMLGPGHFVSLHTHEY